MVLFCGNVFSFGGIVKRWPAAMGIKLLLGREEERAAADAMIGSAGLLFECPIRFAKRAFCTGFAEDVELFWSKCLSPLIFRFRDFGGGIFGGIWKDFHVFWKWRW